MEGHALLGNMTQLGKAEHLKSPAVRQNRAIPAGEFVQSAQFGNGLVTGTKMQMIGVAQHDLRTDVFQIQRGQAAFDGGGGGNVLERGGLNCAVDGGELAAAGSALLLDKTVWHGKTPSCVTKSAWHRQN